MAENILGLLFVASTSRDRFVFRYPPDPISPEARLTQPIYSRATYTAKDSTVDHKAHRLFPRKRRGEGSLASGSRAGLNTHFWSSNASSGGRGAVASRGSNSSADGAPAYSLAGSFHSHMTEAGTTPSDSSSSSDDSDFDRLLDGGASRSNTPRRYSSETDGSNPSSAARPHMPRPFTEIVPDMGRRGSVIESEGTARAAAGSSKRGGNRAQTFVESQYNYALGYSLDFLGDLLTPPRAACNRKFEVGVDELVFIGHPVCNSADGKWTYPSTDSDSDEGEGGDGGDDEPRRVSRGRRMNDTPATRDVSLRPVAEHPESPHTRFERLRDSSTSLTTLFRDAVTRDALSASTNSLAPSMSTGELSTSTVRTSAAGKKEEEPPMLTMFHLVLIIDKPDVKAEGEARLTEIFNHLYREIAFKWTAAAYALQVRDNWVGREVVELERIREAAIADGIPVIDCLRKCVEVSPLADSLHSLFSELHRLKGKSINSHFSFMQTAVAINVGPIPISIVLPPKRQVNPDAEIAAEVDTDSSDSSDDEWEGATGPDGLLVSKQMHPRVEPWQALLMLHEDDTSPGASNVAAREASASSRRNSRSRAAEDELLSALVAECDITKPLHEIAHTLRFDLEGIVMPLARELVQSKRAIVVDVVNVRLRNILIPTSITEHLRSLSQHCVRWNILFSSLPPLVPFLAMISMTPAPFRDLLPPDAQADVTRRDIYIRAIAWLLKSDLVQQARVRARVVASPAVKEAAWRRLWARRRKRWLRERTQSMTSKTSGASGGSRSARASFGATSVSTVTAPMGSGASALLSPPGSDIITPRASDAGLNPMDTAFASRVPRFTNVPPTPLPRTQTLEIVRTPTVDSPDLLDYDSDLEMDSDVDDDDRGVRAGDDADAVHRMLSEFSVSESEPAPATVPHFAASFIFAPARAQKDEARWLRVIREHNTDPVLQSRFDLCVQYFDGVTTFEEIMFRTSLSRRALDRIAQAYRDDLMITIQP